MFRFGGQGPERPRVRHDQPFSTAIPQPSATSLSQASTHVRTWAKLIGMAALMAITSMTVAIYVSAWLALGYLVVMALVLDVPGRWMGAIRVPRVPEKPWYPEIGRDRGGVPEYATVSSPSEAELSSGEEPELGLAASKVKRARPRARKAKGSAAMAPTANLAPIEPSAAAVTWIRVGPGKFVRADSSSAIAASFEDVPAELPGAEIADEDAEDTGLESGERKDGFTRDDPAEAAQDVTETGETGDNGIAPDAPAELVSNAPADPFEVELVTPEAEPLTPVEVSEDTAPEPAIDALQTESETSRTAWFPVAGWRGVSRGRVAAHASTPGNGAQRSAPGNVRWTHVSRVRPGVRRSPRRGQGRGPGRFHKADRTHRPRSPPRRVPIERNLFG
jgi:hypothetical protein